MGKMEAAEQTGSVQPSPNSPAQTVTLRQLSTERQQDWIERIFTRLAALYGAAFGRQWEGTDLSNVKSVWAEKLGGFTAPQIGEAIRDCEDRISPDGKSYPPNLPEFIDMCRGAAKREPKPLAIEAPRLSVEEQLDRAKQLEASASKTKGYDYRGWCKELKRRYLAGEDLIYMQIVMASEAMNEVWDKRQCTPRSQP